MRVGFYDVATPLAGPRERDVEVLPSIGQTIAWHGFKGESSKYFTVVDVVHVFEDREWYKAHPEIGQPICVTLKEITR